MCSCSVRKLKLILWCIEMVSALHYATLFASLLLKGTADVVCFSVHVLSSEGTCVADIFMFGIQEGQNTLSPQCGSQINTLELTCLNVFVFYLRTNCHFVLFYFKRESLSIRQV
jgi:hypothetical protein